MVNDRELCLAAGVNEYVAKPYSLRKLHALNGRLLAQRAAD
jgi:CheY-like chemotaxis protein